MKIYAVLFLFFGLYLSVCIWIFLIVTNSVRKISLHSFFRAKREFVEVVDQQFAMLSENKPIPEAEIFFLCKKLKKKKMKRYFLERFIYYADRIENKENIKEYFKTVMPFVRDMIQIETNIHYSEKSYRLMLIGEFRQDTEEINHIALNALENDSFDVRTNALRALSLIGNSSYFNMGLIKACSSAKYFNTRHISEMIGSYEGDVNELRLALLDSFYKNPDSYRYQVIVFLTRYVCCSTIEFVLEYVHQNHISNKENLIASLRYFSVCEINQKVKEFIYQLLNEEDVEIRAITIKLIPKYFQDDRQIIKRLSGEGFLKSKDWYIRRNSADALVRIGLEKEEIIKNILTDDKYAREALIYAMFDAGITTYEEFIELGGGLNGIA